VSGEFTSVGTLSGIVLDKETAATGGNKAGAAVSFFAGLPQYGGFAPCRHIRLSRPSEMVAATRGIFLAREENQWAFASTTLPLISAPTRPKGR
jgi:hypothetical protein